MCFTDVSKHTKSMKEDIMIEIKWLSKDFLFCEYLCTLVLKDEYQVYLFSSCTVWHSYLRADEWNFQPQSRPMYWLFFIMGVGPGKSMHCLHNTQKNKKANS